MHSRSCDCTIIIPTHNRCEMLAQTLRRLHGLPDEHVEIIVIDNASTDATPRLKSQFPTVQWITRESNEGAASRNLGAAAASGRVLLMLDDDSWPEPGVISRIVERMDGDRGLGAIACRVLLAEGGGRHDAGGVPGIFFNCGGAVRRDAFLTAGGYPAIDYYAEEYFLCCRLWQMGLRVEPHGDLVVHHHRTLQNRSNDRMLRLLVRNNFALWQKFAPESRRADLIESTLERYRRIAVKESAMAGYQQGVAEALCQNQGTPTPLADEQFESLFGLPTARRILREWTDKSDLRAAAVWSRGKGCEQIIDLMISLGINVEAVYDSPDAVAGEAHWRGVRLDSYDRFRADKIDAIIIGTLSPGVADDVMTELRKRYSGVPVISLAPWMHTAVTSEFGKNTFVLPQIEAVV